MIGIVVAALGLIALGGVVVSLVRTIGNDGYGTLPPPRSHREELGTWVDQQLAR